MRIISSTRAALSPHPQATSHADHVGHAGHAAHGTLGARRSRHFDVICAGEALWAMAPSDNTSAARARGLGFRPSGGAVNAAVALARRGLRVGLASALGDDTHGRAFVSRVEAAGVDTGGVALGSLRPGLVFVEGAGDTRRVVPYRVDDDPDFTIPEGWIAPVLLLSGLSPAVPRAAAFCKAARAARRMGAIVVIDVNARRHVWAGRDPRAIRAALHEADVVRVSTEDLTALGLDATALRRSLRPSVTLVLTHGAGAAQAAGPFGEIALAPRAVAKGAPGATPGVGDAFTAAICAELARSGDAAPDRGDLWERALQRGHEAAGERIAAVRARGGQG